MSQSTYKESVIKLAKQIKKEHFLKTFLWAAGIFLTLLWISMLIATSISAGSYSILGEEQTVPPQDIAILNSVLRGNNVDYVIQGLTIDTTTLKFTYTFKEILGYRDWNPLCLTYDPTLAGWFMCVVLAPVGYMGIIFIVAYMKNMITPQQVKKTVRKALQFGYLKQKDVDYVIDEIDYNIGIKERRNETTNTEEQKQT